MSPGSVFGRYLRRAFDGFAGGAFGSASRSMFSSVHRLMGEHTAARAFGPIGPRGFTRRTVHTAGVMTIGLMLAACASIPQPPAQTPPDDAPLSGRLSVKVEGASPRSVSASFDLRGNPRTGSLDLSTPLGSTLAQARWAPGQVVLSTPKGDRSYPDLDALTRDVLGESVPVAALFDWLRARPWPGAPSQSSAPPAQGFEQLGWNVELSRYDSGWVDAARSAQPPVTVRVRLDR